jgi:hypothetical protein
VQVRESFQRRWLCKLPRELCKYLDDTEHVPRDTRLAALLAWMHCHAPRYHPEGADWHTWWVSWLDALPTLSDVPLLCNMTATEQRVMKAHAPHLASRAEQASAAVAASWRAAIREHPQIWLAMKRMAPGSSGPVSYPLAMGVCKGIHHICHCAQFAMASPAP